MGEEKQDAKTTVAKTVGAGVLNGWPFHRVERPTQKGHPKVSFALRCVDKKDADVSID